MAAVALGDVCWTHYFIETGNRNALKAGFWSAMIMVCGSFVTVEYINNRWYAVAAFIGAFVGTYATVRLKK